jgi:Frag1/DRAM/Sfk1 family
MSLIITSSYIITLISDRFLRRHYQLHVNKSKIGRWLSTLLLFFAIMSSVFLILACVFDVIRYERLHWKLSFAFLLCVFSAATIQLLEFQHLKSEYGGAYKTSYAVKFYTLLVIGIGAICVIVGYGSVPLAERYNLRPWVLGVMTLSEWFMAFTFNFYLFSMVFDTYHIVRVGRRKLEADGIWPDERDCEVEYLTASPDYMEKWRQD